MNSLITENKISILRLSQQHGVKNVRLFGSMARDEASAESDVDFLVDLEDGCDLFDLGELLVDLQDLLHRKVDLVTEISLHPKISVQILKEAIPL